MNRVRSRVHSIFFLSHSFQDAEIILTVKRGLEGMGYSVFVDWVERPELDRTHVTKEVAAFLRNMMQQAKSLFYVATDNATHSNWMPWECGYFDGIKQLVAIMPVVRGTSQSDSFVGREYLGLYYYVSGGTIQGSDDDELQVVQKSCRFSVWLCNPRFAYNLRSLDIQSVMVGEKYAANFRRRGSAEQMLPSIHCR